MNQSKGLIDSLMNASVGWMEGLFDDVTTECYGFQSSQSKVLVNEREADSAQTLTFQNPQRSADVLEALSIEYRAIIQ